MSSYYERKIKSEENTINKYIDNKNYSKVGMGYSDRYCSKEDISTLEFTKFPKKDNEEDFKYLTLKRNFISDVELDDLTEIMCRNSEMIDELEGYTDVESLEKCMKSIVRIVHRFSYTREHDIPVTETHQPRDSNTIW